MVRKETRNSLRLLLIGLLLAGLVAGCGNASGQRVGEESTPPLELVGEDKGPAILDGCRSGVEHVEPWTCIYGDPSSARTVVLWGDSHAMQYTPPLVALAERNGWRLVALFRSNCLVADTDYKPECDAWRSNAMERIEAEEPDLVVTSTSTGNGYALWQDGERLTREASEPLLRDAFAETLRQLMAMTGERPGSVVVIRDLPWAEEPPVNCLEQYPDDPGRCAFRGIRKNPPGFDLEAAELVDGVRLVDLSSVVCPGGRCPAVRDGAVVYRDAVHLSATYALTLADQLGPLLESP